MIDLKLLQGKIEPGNKEVAVFIDTLFDDTMKYYLKYHRDWYLNERFARGDHWVVYNKTINKVQSIPSTNGEVRRVINKIKSQIRGVKNFIKKSQPRWEVQPDNSTPEALEEARKKNKILQYIYRTKQIPLFLTDIIVSSLKFSVGFMEVGMVNKEGEDKIDIWADDTFDILIDPYARNTQSARFFFKAFKKPVNDIKIAYNFKGEIVSDNKQASTQYGELLEMEKRGTDTVGSSKDMESAIVKELWIKYQGADNKPKVKVFTVVSKQLLKVTEKPYRRFPLFAYNPEKESNCIYSDPWIKPLISINKSLDKTASQIEGYIQRMLAGKYLIKQGVEVSTITDKGAEIITYKGNVAPLQMNLQPLPAAPFTYVANLERWIEELGGIREASLGQAPGGITSGKALEALQSADAGTVAEPIENLEMLLEDMGEFILELIEDHVIASQEITEGGETIKFMGASALEEGRTPPEGVMVVKSSKVKVVIVPEVAYSEEHKKEWLMRLAEAKLIDPQTLLEKLSISNIGEIIERMNKNKEEEFKQEMSKQAASHASAGGSGSPEDTADLADQENMKMASGQQVQPTPQALWSPEHTQLHMAFIQSNGDAYKQQQQAFDQHIQQEEQYNQQ
ncbi:MAG: hypothetical protein Q8L27_01675 [archaeon]|nr:hypothetical protein [archaeon]